MLRRILDDHLLTIGATLIFVVALALARLGLEPMATWLYPVAWWALIVLVDHLVHLRKGESLLTTGVTDLIYLIAASIVFWSFFEILNLRVENWYYVNVPRHLPLRVLAEIASFSTVLPAIFEIADLLEVYGFFVAPPPPEVYLPPRGETGMLAAGAGAVLLALLMPTFFYPLVWIGPILVIEALLHRWGASSLTRDFETGQTRRLKLLMTAGLLAGLVWEWLNWQARAHWCYTIPGFAHPYYFRMPWAGLLGFLPFGALAYSFWLLADFFRGGRGYRLAEWTAERDARLAATSGASRLLVPAIVAGAAVVAGAIAGIEWRTIASVRSTPEDIAALIAFRSASLAKEWEEDRKLLSVHRLEDPYTLVRLGFGRRAARLALDRGVPLHALEPGLSRAALLTTGGIGLRNAKLIQASGIDSIDLLVRVPPERLHLLLEATANKRPELAPAPSLGRVRNWMRDAGALTSD